MQPSAPLLKVIKELSDMRPFKRESVLEKLSSDERELVLSLLNPVTPSEEGIDHGSGVDTSMLSPWLEGLVRTPDKLTGKAHIALQTSVEVIGKFPETGQTTERRRFLGLIGSDGHDSSPR